MTKVPPARAIKTCRPDYWAASEDRLRVLDNESTAAAKRQHRRESMCVPGDLLALEVLLKLGGCLCVIRHLLCSLITLKKLQVLIHVSERSVPRST